MKNLLLILMTGFLLTSCSTTPGLRSSNPILSSTKDPVFIPSSVEIMLGAQTALAVKQQYKTYPDQKLQAYVRGLGEKLAAQSSRRDAAWSFTVLDSKELNAFAAPGGPIYITTGLLKNLNNEAELAAVLGHEIGHVEKKHAIKRMQRTAVLSFGMSALTQWLDSDRAKFMAQMAGIAANLALLRNSREAELESDEVGMGLARAENYDPSAMIHVQLMLGKAGGGYSNPVAEMMATHPPGEQRVAQAKNLLPKFKGGKKILAEGPYQKAIAGLK